MSRRSAILVAVAVLAASAPGVGAPDDTPGVASMLEMLRADRSAKVRAQAALSLRASAGDREVREALRAALDDPEAIVRAAAANALGAVPHTDAFEALSRRAKDRDPLVSKWAAWALRRTLAVAPVVAVEAVEVRVAGRDDRDVLGPAFEGALLGSLLRAGSRFQIRTATRSFDFSDEGGAEADGAEEPSARDRHLLDLVRQGRFDAAALESDDDVDPDEAVATVRLSADVEVWDAPPVAMARARLKAGTTGGVGAWEVGAEGVGRAPYVPPSERDEYTMEPSPAELRIQAVDQVGRAVAEALVRSMAAPESPPGGRAGAGAR